VGKYKCSPKLFVQKEGKKKVEEGEGNEEDSEEGGSVLCHCGVPAKREVVKKEGKNKGKHTLRDSLTRQILLLLIYITKIKA